MRREELSKGVFLRLISKSFGIPAGTLATVEAVGTLWNGQWFYTVQYLNPPPGTGRRPIADRSLNLFEADLNNFETISPEQAAEILTVRRPLRRQTKLSTWLKVRGNPDQLRLFEDF
jgi:hypothetical protein